MINGDKKKFLTALADWIKQWYQSPAFALTPQTASALTATFCAHAVLIDDLLNEAHHYVITARLQSDPIERRFSQYRQMSGGRFLASLREVLNSERILRCRSLIKESINIWEENPTSDNQECITVIEDIIDRTQEIVESVPDENSAEVATTIVGYVAKE